MSSEPLLILPLQKTAKLMMLIPSRSCGGWMLSAKDRACISVIPMMAPACII